MSSFFEGDPTARSVWKPGRFEQEDPNVRYAKTPEEARLAAFLDYAASMSEQPLTLEEVQEITDIASMETK